VEFEELKGSVEESDDIIKKLKKEIKDLEEGVHDR
jgi:peptidoglycan hydrolase CwlO-like protein